MKKMSPKTLEISDQFISLLIEQNCTELRGLFSQIRGARLFGEPGLLWVDSGISYSPWNSVIWSRLAPRQARSKLREIKVHFQERKVPFCWWTGPSTLPKNLKNMLLENGFNHSEDSPGMAIGLSGNNIKFQQSNELKINPVRRMEELKELVKIIKICYQMPEESEIPLLNLFEDLGLTGDVPLFHYLGFYREKPVAVASLFPTAGVGGIHFVGTLPEFRGRGFGREITLFAMRQAQLAGFSWAVLRASKMGESIYRRIGFKKYCNLSMFVFHG